MKPSRFAIFASTLVFTMSPSLVAEAIETDEHDLSASVSFARDIRPILSDHCFACHGPDQHDRAAGLRLDTADGIRDVVNVDEVDASELVSRIESDDAEVVMPPPEHHKPISDKQRTLLKAWIAAGARLRVALGVRAARGGSQVRQNPGKRESDRIEDRCFCESCGHRRRFANQWSR